MSALIRSCAWALVLVLAPSAPGAAQGAPFDAWFAAGEFAAVEREIEHRLRADSGDRAALLARARLGLEWHDASRLDAAIGAMQRCLERHPDDARCHQWLGRAYGRMALDGAVFGGVRFAGRVRAHLERAAALAPQAIDIRHDLHRFYLLAPGLAGGGRARARASLDEFARLRPAQAPLLRAQLDLAEDRLDGAEAVLLSFAGGDEPALREVWADLLEALGNRHHGARPPRLAEARRVYEFAAARFPERELFQRALGRVAQEQGRYAEAAGHFERALAIRPQPGAHYRLAQVAERLGERERAIEHYEKTLRFPHGAPARVLRDASERLIALQRR